MNILTLCTALPTALLSLQKGKDVFCLETDASSKHSENLLVSAEKLLAEAGLKLNEMDVLAVVIGPGSFTGLRIAAASAKAILTANKLLKAAKINTLEFLAFAGGGGLAVMDAHSGRFYVAEYDQKGQELLPPSLLTKEELLEKAKDKTILTCEDLPFERTQKIQLTAQNLAKLAEKQVKNGVYCTESELLPLYLRKSQAEENWKGNA